MFDVCRFLCGRVLDFAKQRCEGCRPILAYFHKEAPASVTTYGDALTSVPRGLQASGLPREQRVTPLLGVANKEGWS